MSTKQRINNRAMEMKRAMTSQESFAILREIENRKYPGGISLTDWTRQIQEEKIKAIKGLVPEEGLGCTICYYSDRRAATVTRIISPCKIEVTFNEVRCIDYYAGDYEILPKLKGEPKVFTKRRNGYWVMEGQPYKDGVLLMLHYQSHYIDPSF